MNDRVLVRRLPDSPPREGRILLVTDERRTQHRGLVIAVGPGRRDPDDPRRRIPLQVKPGDVVLYGPYNDLEGNARMNWLEADLVLIQEADIRVIVLQ